MRGEEVFVHKDGSFYPVAYTASPLQNESGQTVGTIIEVRDVSSEKKAEASLREESRVLEVLNSTGADIAAELDLDRLVQMVTDAGVKLTGAKFGAFFYNVLDESGESFLLYTLSGADRADFERFGNPRATAVFEPTFKGDGIVRSDDILLDPRYGKNDPHFGMPKGHLPVRSYLAVPVISRSGEVLGGLFFGHPEARRFTERHERLMVGIAGQAATAIDNAHLFRSAQHELSERRRTESALRESESRFRHMADNAPALIWASDAEGRITFANRRYETDFGLSPDELLQDGWRQVVHEDDVGAFHARFLEALSKRERILVEVRVWNKDGELRWLRCEGVPRHDENRCFLGFIGCNVDITEARIAADAMEAVVEKRTAELQQTQEALRQSQKMEAVGQLTGGLAHDFNNLLAGISGSLELMSNRIVQGRYNDIERYVSAAQGAAKRAAALTHRLLAFSRRQTLDPKPTNVNKLASEMEELIRRTVGPQIKLETVAAGGLWTTLVDPNQLENALLNLCINARDAMPDGGKITIETANKWLDDRAARERDLPPGQYISLCVSDTGTGMTPEVIEKAFDPFFTTKPIGMGTGLGLSMIYGFVRQSGGQVRIYSEVGQGTTICLYLPRHYGQAEDVDAPDRLADVAHDGQGRTVLVVDDEPLVRMLIAEVLEELGYAVVEAADGPAGLKVLQSNARLDLLITDVGLPGGMNGRQLADAARAQRADLKVLFITGYAENAVLNHGHLEPGMHIMTKPFAMDALANKLQELMLHA